MRVEKVETKRPFEPLTIQIVIETEQELHDCKAWASAFEAKNARDRVRFGMHQSSFPGWARVIQGLANVFGRS